MNQFWRENGSVVEFVMLNAMFALSTFVALCLVAVIGCLLGQLPAPL